jgi:heat shock protein HslJ
MNQKKSSSFQVRRAVLQITGILLVIAILISACTTTTPTPAPTPTNVPPTQAPTPVVIDVNKLYANPWILVAYGDPANPTVVQGGIDLTLTFTSDGNLSGFGGCNSFSGTFQAAPDGSMSVGPLASTLMACATGMDVETAYLSALQQARSFSFTSEGRLQIMYGPEGSADQAMVFIVGVKPLTGTNWVLVSSGDPNNPTPVEQGIVITAVFSEDGYLSGLSGCNQYNVSYTLSGEQLTLGPIAITQMACTTGMDAEQAYLSALTTAQQAKVTGLTLTITYNQGAGVLNYIAANVPLENSLWTLTLMNGQPITADTNITATFTPGDTPGEGVINGSSGCNTYNASYTLNGSNITVGPAAVTRMYCEGTMDTEQAYLTALQASTSYEIFVDTLVLTNPSGSLTFTVNRTPLTGALWKLVALGDVNKPDTPVTGSDFSAQFIRIPGAPSGVLNGTTGCNEYTTAFTASTTEIKINLPVATQNKTCVPGLVDQEQIYYLALNNATTYQISGNTLTIPYDSGKQALVFEGTQLTAAERPPLSDLNGTTWYLWYFDDNPILAGTTIYAQIAINADGASGTLSGSAGCNTYVASFGDNMAVQTTLNATQNCQNPTGIMDQEKVYVSDLSRAYGYWQTGDQLIINTGQGVLTYKNTKPASSYDQTHLLVGPTWYLVAYGSTYSLAGTQEPYTLFKSDGTLEGYTGCNSFSGNYTTAIQAITITNLNATQQACPSSALQGQQDAMLKILGSAKTYQVAESVMQIVSDSGVLNYSLTPLHRQDEIQPPTAMFSYPTEAMVNTVVTFDAQESYSQVPILYYDWQFGDGNTGTGELVQHVYSNPGTYDVKLRVTDERGNQGAVTQKITITSAPPVPTATPAPTAQPTATTPPAQPTATQPPAPTATPEPTQPPAAVPPIAKINGPSNGYVGEPVSFDASASAPGSSPIVSYAWTFGDGTTAGPSDSSGTTMLYNSGGSYQVTVVVTDQNGLSNESSTSITISTRLNTPTVWILDSYGNQSVLPGTGITLQFLDGQIAGFSGCNSYTGTYTATANPDGTYSVTITGLISSGAACPTDIMDQESRYMALLGNITTAQPQGNILTLTAPEGTLVYHEAGTLAITPY